MCLENSKTGYNIVLCGFMGSGKSTVGKELARLMKMNFIDIDTYIESRENMTVSEIFNLKGESYFRKLETKTLKSQVLGEHKVIALGGGSIICKENIRIVRKYSKIFFLNASKEVIMKRLKDDNSRPLLKAGDKETVLNKLYEERFCIYSENSDFTINADGNVSEIINDILSCI